MIEIYIHKDDTIEGELLKFLGNGYQVLFDNDGEPGDYYWIKLAHPEWTESQFIELQENEIVTELDEKVYNDIDKALADIHRDYIDWHADEDFEPYTEKQVNTINENIRMLNEVKELYDFIELKYGSPTLDEDVSNLVNNVSEVRDVCEYVLNSVSRFDEPLYTLDEAKAILGVKDDVDKIFEGLKSNHKPRK